MKYPEDMTIEELIAHRATYSMSEEEIENQACAIAAAEARHSGDPTATMETMRAVRKMDLASEGLPKGTFRE